MAAALWARREKRVQPFPGKHPNQGVGPWVAGVLLTLWTALLYRRWITDTLTGYKLYPAGSLRRCPCGPAALKPITRSPPS